MLARFILRLLGLWGRHALPEPFRGRINDVDYDVQPLPRGMVSISIYLARDRMVIRPECFRRGEGPAVHGGHAGGCYMDALFGMDAVSVDIGSGGDKIEAIFPGEFILVNKAFAEHAAGLMSCLRDMATGEEAACEPQQPWAKETGNTIDVDGEPVAFEFSSCLVDTNEEAGTLGNLYVMVRTTPALPPEKLEDNLRLEVPGYDDLLYAEGYGLFEGGLEVGFGPLGLLVSLDYDARHEWMRETAKALQDVNLYWGKRRETKLATVPCVRASEDA